MMEKLSFLRNILVRLFIFCVVVLCFRFAYVVIIRGESCDLGDFCFFSLHENFNVVLTYGVIGRFSNFSSPLQVNSPKPDKVSLLSPSKPSNPVSFYSGIFRDLIAKGYLTRNSKTLCIESEKGPSVFALQKLGVSHSQGISEKDLKSLVSSGKKINLPFNDEAFDLVFSGEGMIEKVKMVGDFAVEVARILKPEGYLVIHTSYKDSYSFNSLLDLFNSCRLVKSRKIDGFNPNTSLIREIVIQKESTVSHLVDVDSTNQCSIPGYKQEMVSKGENLITEEPKKPWITLKKNLQNIKYLPSMVDISFKERYIYIDVGSRSYGSSIVSWFKKQYPKQNKTFEIYAIEADKHFHEEYKYKKGVTLLPYAAWVRNESLFFEINHTPGDKDVVKGRGMGRIQPIQSIRSKLANHVDEIHGFDFADWLKRTVSEKDFVVMKMDVEGTEFDLIPRLFETGAICLIDEIFLECHYNRWQKCCPGERSSKYQNTYEQCLDLFSSVRDSGVLVHQWF